MAQEIERFLDENGRIKQLPSKRATQLKIFAYLAEKFESGKEYSEHEVNAIISSWHTFGDYFVIRRGLVESGLIKRLPNGSKYWRVEPEAEAGE